jgi:hypothetical protein
MPLVRSKPGKPALSTHPTFVESRLKRGPSLTEPPKSEGPWFRRNLDSTGLALLAVYFRRLKIADCSEGNIAPIKHLVLRFLESKIIVPVTRVS